MCNNPRVNITMINVFSISSRSAEQHNLDTIIHWKQSSLKPSIEGDTSGLF